MAYRTAPLPTSELLTPYVPPAAIVTQFQAGHGFTTQAADASSNLNDTSNFVIGSQAATLVTAGAGATTYLLHKGLPAVNMTNQQFVVVIECDSLAHIASSGPLEFLAGSGASSSTTYQWQLTTSGTIDQNLMQGGLWIYYTLNFADATINGSPVKTALTDFYIRLNDDTTGNKVTVRVNAIYTIPDSSGSSPAGPLGYPSGVASVCFDDGFISQLTNGKPVLDSYGFTPSTYVIWDQVGQSNRLTAAQYLAAQDISGWEVNSHSLTDADHTAGFDNISLAELETNVAAQQAIMAANGYQGKGSAYPKGQLTPAVRAMLRKYFAYVRGTFNKTLETWPPADIFNLRAVSAISPVSGGYSPSAISQSGGLIDQAVTNRRWLILTFHKIIGNVTSCTNTTGTTYRIVYTDTSPPYNTGNSVTLQGFTPSGLNGTYTVTNDGTTGGFGYIEVAIPANPGNATVQGTALSATTDCDLASYTAIIAKLSSSAIPVRTIAAVLTGMAYGSGSSGGAVSSVFTRTGAVTAQSGDYTAAQVGAVATTAVGAASGVAALDSGTHVPTAQLPAATTSAQGAVILDGTAADIQPDGAQAAGSIGKAADGGHAHPATFWVPSDNALLTAACDPFLVTQSSTPIAGTLYLVKLPIRQAMTLSELWWSVTTAGSGTSTGTFTGLYSSAGTLLSGSADVGSGLTSTGGRGLALTTPQALSAGTFVWAALLINMPTMPVLGRSNGFSGMLNLGLSAAAFRFATNGTGQTTLPSTITPASNSTSSLSFWAGGS